MEHTHIITAKDLEDYAERIYSRDVIPELIALLVHQAPDLSVCRIPYGEMINQSGFDGIVQTPTGFRQFVPTGDSCWEIGTDVRPIDKATREFRKRTDWLQSLPSSQREGKVFIFVTPRSGGAGGWQISSQQRWCSKRLNKGWKDVKIIDGIQIADWMREFPAIGRWMAKKIGAVTSSSGLLTPSEHWENLLELSRKEGHVLPPEIFLTGRELVCGELEKMFEGNLTNLYLLCDGASDVNDFVSSFLASLSDKEKQRAYSGRCLFVGDPEVWDSIARLRTSHVLVADSKLALDEAGRGEQLRLLAQRHRHSIILPVHGSYGGGGTEVIRLRNPSARLLETVLEKAGFPKARASELAEAGGLSLHGLKQRLAGLSVLPSYAESKYARLLAQAMLIGKWDGNCVGDRALIEFLVGKPYWEWTTEIREAALHESSPLSNRNEEWKIMVRGEAWAALGRYLNNSDLDQFKQAAIEVLAERHPKFDLPPEDHYAASVYQKETVHSERLRNGIAESLALLGSRADALSNCSNGRARSTADMVTRQLLEDRSADRWASLNYVLPLLAEASPNEFLSAIEKTLTSSANNVFEIIFSYEKAGGTLGANYMTGLLWGLETLAWDPEFLSRVILLLGELAEIDPGGRWVNRPINSQVNILLPWRPHTAASIEQREAAVRTLQRELPQQAWKLLLSLMPQAHASTMGTRKPVWRRYSEAHAEKGVTNKEYWHVIESYAVLTIDSAHSDIARLSDLIERIPDLPDKAQSILMRELASEEIKQRSSDDKEKLWKSLTNLAARHRKFRNAKWAMPVVTLKKIEDLAVGLEPDDPFFHHLRLFDSKNIELMDAGGDYQAQREKLLERRKQAVMEIYTDGGLEHLMKFVQKATFTHDIGDAFGRASSPSNDKELLPSCLNCTEKGVSSFIRSFIHARFWTFGLQWVEMIPQPEWTEDDRIALLLDLPFTQEIWRLADFWLGKHAEKYWKSVFVNAWISRSGLIEAINRLLEHCRPASAIACLSVVLHTKEETPTPELVVKTLMEACASKEAGNADTLHDSLALIEWLQENEKTKYEDLCRVEWAYMSILDFERGSPVALDRKLAEDAMFYCEIVSLVFKSRHSKEIEIEPTETQKSVALNGFKLLDAWRTVPGTHSDGEFGPTQFQTWVSEAKRLSIESGHYEAAMNRLGHVLAYARRLGEGLWLDPAIAEVLNGKDAEEMRSGYISQRFNMRGVHGYSAGNEEKEYAIEYRKEAEVLELNGYIRFANALRRLAEQYERDAEREAANDPFEDW